MQEVPKGKLLIIGGAEDIGDPQKLSCAQEESRNFQSFEVLQELLPDNSKADYRIEVITTASEEPNEMGKKYQKAFERANISNVGIIHISNREEANAPATIKRIEKASAVFFSGGDQFRLSTILGSSQLMEVITRKYIREPGFIVGGTSAGAMAISSVMIYEGDSHKALLKGTVKISSGLGLIDHCIIDTHFINRGRFGRLAESIITNPACIGLGLGEDTALVIYDGNKAECCGSGMVVVIDSKELGHTNIAYVEKGTPLSAENLTVHLLTKGNGFSLKERKFIPAKKDMELEESIRSH
ncbi:cyanophycinase [Xanthocytophaga agilis]|uniref:Cyanophycinase n=1 Tax=Xanthocytophaga agilis TaxID=3048010 RepID=A0AAE3UHD1_9BACT|nr:cyanophycinase [Xanthocytophaga agilis]MDJ1505903.1 cyanophycinase [Xanthocytophaga agilis]